jgi:hypothetical protein
MPTKKTTTKKPKAPTTRSRKSTPAGTTAPKTARRPRAAAVADATAAPVAVTEPLSAERRHHMIEVAAYFLSESRGFVPGREMDDWLSAERAIDQQSLR